MTIVQWPDGVNNRFYAKKDTPDDNAITTEYASGRKAVVLRNTRWPVKFTASLSLDTRNAEYDNFWTWYKDVLGGLAGVFKCDVLGEGRTWRFAKTPEDGGGIPFREVSLEVEEAWA